METTVRTQIRYILNPFLPINYLIVPKTYNQRRIPNPGKHLRRSFLQKELTAFS